MILGTGANSKPCKDRWGSFVLLTILLLCLCVSSWGACQTSSASWSYSSPKNCDNCASVNTNCGVRYEGGYYYSTYEIEFSCRSEYPNYSGTCSGTYAKYATWRCVSDYRCTTQAEADSVYCGKQGGNWNGTTCSHVTNDTTTYNNLVDNCQNNLEGVAHFQFNDLGNVVGYCDMCDRSGDPDDIYGGYTNTFIHGEIEYRRYQCCQGQGSIGSSSEFGCNASGGACVGANCDWRGSNGGASTFTYPSCDLSKPVALGMTCEEYATGEDESQGSDQSSASDSTGTGGSSDSGNNNDSAGMDFEYDYNDSLHKIIDSLGALLSIARLMVQQEDATGGDTIIVNVERDTVINNITVDVPAPNVYFNDSVYKTQIGNLESIQSSIRLLLSPGDTTNRTTFYDTVAGSFNKIGRALDTAILFGFRIDSVLFTEGLVDTARYGYHYSDSVAKYWGGHGTGGIRDMMDSISTDWGIDSLPGFIDSGLAYGVCQGDSCPPCTGADCMGDLGGLGGDYGDSIAGAFGEELKQSVQEDSANIEDEWTRLYNELKQNAFFTKFDSAFYNSVGATIPNSNTCPNQCSSFTVESENSWLNGVIIDYKLCQPISTFGGMNALQFVKLLLRILTIVTCLSIVMWEVSSSRNKMGF